MMDIDIELFKLIKKYDIYKSIPEVEELYKQDVCIHYLHELFDSIPQEKVIALRGGSGEHTERLLTTLSEKERQRITFLIDKNVSLTKDNYEIIHPSEISEHHIDIIILSSLRLKTDFIRELVNMEGSFQIIDLYDYFAQKGIICTQEYYLRAKYFHMHETYIDVNNTLKLYKRASEELVQKFYLEKLIAQCVEVRDFLSVFFWIGEYQKKGWDVNATFGNFQTELEAFFHTIKQQLSIKQTRNVIINWIDNVNAEEFYNTEFAQNRRKDSCVFENAYTSTPWTHFTQDAIFLGKLPIEGKTYRNKKFDESNSEVLSLLKDNDYQFLYIANPGMYQNLFDADHLAQYHREFNNLVMGNRAISECSTRLQWYSLRQQMLTERAVCHLIHNLAETHIPYIYTDIDSVSNDTVANYLERDKYRLEGMDFITRQIDWYSDFFSEHTYQIYWSDHGDGGRYSRAYEKGRTNIPFIIKGPNILAGQEYRFYTHLHFARLLKIVLEGDMEQWDKVFDDYIIYENLDFYNLTAIKDHIARWICGYTPIDMANFQVRGIRTGEDLYVVYAAGRELYFRLPDEETNLIHEESWQSRINELRKKCTRAFVHIEQEPLFRDTHMLYDFLSLVPEGNVQW